MLGEQLPEVAGDVTGADAARDVTAQRHSLRFVADEIAAAFRGNKHLTFRPGSGTDVPDVPASLSEPDDMRIVVSPCHSYEPIKVPDHLSGPFRCLIYGAAFAL
jgi:hypothetical protein